MQIHRWAVICGRRISVALFMAVFFPLLLSSAASAGQLTLGVESGAVGDSVAFAVALEDAPNEVGAFGFDILFDEQVLTFQGVDFADGLIDRYNFKSGVNPVSGLVRIGGFDTGNAAIGQGQSGMVALVVFKVVGQGDCPLTLANLKDHISGWKVRDGAFEYAE